MCTFMDKNQNKSEGHLQQTDSVPSNQRITKPSFRRPEESQLITDSEIVRHISVEVIAAIQSTTTAPPPSPTRYSLINPLGKDGN